MFLGVGGSATVDFGIGALHALGVKLYDAAGKEFKPKDAKVTGGDIKDIEDLEYGVSPVLPGLKLHLVCDVNNPLLGPNGAVYVYGRQKGAKEHELPILESYMAKLSAIIKKKSHGKVDLDNMPKAGAAGGIVAGMTAFFDCEFHSGIRFVAELLGLEEAVKQSDAVITGEGAFDTQTLEGKTVSHVIKLAKKYGKKVIVICGKNKVDPAVTKTLGIQVFDLKSRFDLDTCFKKTAMCIEKIVHDELATALP